MPLHFLCWIFGEQVLHYSKQQAKFPETLRWQHSLKMLSYIMTPLLWSAAETRLIVRWVSDQACGGLL